MISDGNIFKINNLNKYAQIALAMLISCVFKFNLNAKNQIVTNKAIAFQKNSDKTKLHTPVYATWIMVWIGSTEGWFNPESYNRATMWVNNTWKAINWNDNAQVDEFVLNMKNAGIKVLICDLTNGLRWMDKVQYIQNICAKNDMQVCVATNYKGDFETLEAHAKIIYDNLAGPNAPNSNAYFNKDGKPLIVSYCNKIHYEELKAYSSPMKTYFNYVWSSGEQSEADKWGWQLEPMVGPVPSDDAMFVTSSIKWAPSSKPGLWRKSLAWLDYNFLIARKNNPNHIIVGSYDDMHERNGWLIANTTNSEQGKQMRDKFGAISTDAYYKRVKEWTSGANVSYIPHGFIRDGCYLIKNKRSKLLLQMRGGNGRAGSVLEQSSTAHYPLNQYFWFYHLGHNIYRIIPLTTGLPLTPSLASTEQNTIIVQDWDLDVASQKWQLEIKNKDEYYIRNVLSNKYFDVRDQSVLSGSEIVQSNKTENKSQIWEICPIAQL